MYMVGLYCRLMKTLSLSKPLFFLLNDEKTFRIFVCRFTSLGTAESLTLQDSKLVTQSFWLSTLR